MGRRVIEGRRVIQGWEEGHRGMGRRVIEEGHGGGSYRDGEVGHRGMGRRVIEGWGGGSYRDGEEGHRGEEGHTRMGGGS